MVLSGISCFFLWFGTSESMMIGMLCLYNGLTISAWNSLDVVTVELYPTDRRYVEMGLQQEVLWAPWDHWKSAKLLISSPKWNSKEKKSGLWSCRFYSYLSFILHFFNKAKHDFFFIDYYTQYHKNVITLKTVCRLVSQFENIPGDSWWLLRRESHEFSAKYNIGIVTMEIVPRSL